MRHWLPIVLILLAHGPASGTAGGWLRPAPRVVSGCMVAVAAVVCEAQARRSCAEPRKFVLPGASLRQGRDSEPAAAWREPGTDGARMRDGPESA